MAKISNLVNIDEKTKLKRRVLYGYLEIAGDLDNLRLVLEKGFS